MRRLSSIVHTCTGESFVRAAWTMLSKPMGYRPTVSGNCNGRRVVRSYSVPAAPSANVSIDSIGPWLKQTSSPRRLRIPAIRWSKNEAIQTRSSALAATMASMSGFTTAEDFASMLKRMVGNSTNSSAIVAR